MDIEEILSSDIYLKESIGNLLINQKYGLHLLNIKPIKIKLYDLLDDLEESLK